MSGLEVLLGSAFAVVYGGGMLVAVWFRHVSSGWTSIAAAGFDTSTFPHDGYVEDAPWLSARIGMKHFEASGALTYFPLRGQANGAGLVLKTLQRGRSRRLSIPWDQVAIAGDISARDAAVALKKGKRTLAVITIGRDETSLRAEFAMERGHEPTID